MANAIITPILIYLIFTMVGSAAEIHVSPDGDVSIQQAFERAEAGDTIFLREGVYREQVILKNRSGRDGAPITLTSFKNEKAVLSGLDVVALEWRATNKRGMYVADYSGEAFEQLFVGGKPMLEARWPNVPMLGNGEWNFFLPEVWAEADADGNRHGTVKDADLAKTGWDVTGARAVLNVDHQFYTWTREVEQHGKGADAFTYALPLDKSVSKIDETGGASKYNDDRYYLVGKPEFWMLRANGFTMYITNGFI